MNARPDARSLVAIAVATASALAFQVAVTRLFSAVLAYHFSFLAISLAMLGTGCGGLVLYVRPAWFTGSAERLLARWSVVLGISLIALPLVMVYLDLSGVNDLGLSFALNLMAACVASAIPSFAAGIVVALAIDRYRARIGIVYSVDLLGAGLGALLVVPLMWVIEAPTLIVLLGLTAAAAGWLFGTCSPEAVAERRASLVVAALALLVAGAGAHTRLLFLEVLNTNDPDSVMLADRWTPISRVTAYKTQRGGPFAGLFYDRVWAPIAVVEPGQIPDYRVIRTGPSSIGYQMTGPGRALIIGGGGGRDIWTALSEGQKPVDVIELSEGNRAVVDEDVSELSGSPYSFAGVHTVIGDGRSVLSGRDVLYDTIHIGFTDTLSINAAQGYVLTENNLYTIEAYLEYLRHLKPAGILNVSRAIKLVGDEALRATVLAMAGLEAYGIQNPRDHVIVILGRDLIGPFTGTVLARKQPFTRQEVARVRRLAAERASGILYAPGGPYVGDWQELAESPDLWTFCRSHPLDVCPPTDNQPFFFSMQRLGSIGERTEGYTYVANPVSVLFLTLGILLILSGLAFVVPMFMAAAETRPGIAALSYFAAIGLGFMLFEMALIQRLVLFLGYPTYALSVVIFSLLVFSGIGSLLTSRFRDARKALSRALLTTFLLITIAALGLQTVLSLMMYLPFEARVVISILLIMPFGLGLGMAMPMGLTRLSAMTASGIPYAWGVNGIASVLASVLGIAIAIYFGFTATTLAAAACYLFAFVHARWGEWREAEPIG